MFIAGLEVDLATVRRQGRVIAWTSVTGIIIPFAAGFGLVMLLPNLWGGHAERGLTFALFIGTALSISALPVIARILIDLRLIKKDVGVIILSSATIDDLIGWSLFAVILSSMSSGAWTGVSFLVPVCLAAGLIALILSAGRRPGGRVTSPAHDPLELRGASERPSLVIAMTLVLVLSAAILAETAGIHGIFGAFLVGVAARRHLAGSARVYETARTFVLGFFAPVYFVSVGLKANFVTSFDPLLVATILIIACAGKVGGASLGARLGGLPIRPAFAVGFGMNARGAIEIILASLALEYRLIDQRIFVALIVMALATSVISGPFMQRLLADEKSDSRERASGNARRMEDGILLDERPEEAL